MKTGDTQIVQLNSLYIKCTSTVYAIIFAYRYFCGFGLHVPVGAKIGEGLIS